jgi:hypothetical protein
MARESGSNGSYLHPAGPHGHFPLPLPLALAILSPLTGDAGDHTDYATPLLSVSTGPSGDLVSLVIRARASICRRSFHPMPVFAFPRLPVYFQPPVLPERGNPR